MKNKSNSPLDIHQRRSIRDAAEITSLVYLKTVYKGVVLLCLISVVIGLFHNRSSFGRDSTDPESGSRSGIKVYVDHETGINYLNTGSGSLIPRLNADGSIYNSK